MAEENINITQATETDATNDTNAQPAGNASENTPDYEAVIAQLKAENERYKEAASRANSQAADFKRQVRERQSEAERAEAERKEREAAQAEELAQLRKSVQLTRYANRLMESGYDAATANSMAANLPDGITDDFFAAQKTFIEAQKQLIKSEVLNEQPKPTTGKPLTGGDVVDPMVAAFRKGAGL